MAIPVHLQQFKAAGIYRVVFDKSTIVNVDSQILRLVVGYSEQGPFNIPVYVKDTTEFRTLYGDISKKLEKRGIYFHRIALQALAAGPILCLNLKKFDGETVDGATINSAFNPKFNPIDTVKLNVEDIYDTSRFWELSAAKLNDLKAVDGTTMDQYINICTTNTAKTSATYFIRKASGLKVSSYNMTINSWYADNMDAMPEYLEAYKQNLVSDYFAEVYVFKGKFSPKQVLASETLKNYFIVKKNAAGEDELYLRDKVYNAFGEPTDTLDALYYDETSGALGHYIGSLIPYFKNKQGSYAALDILFNADQDVHNMMMSFNTDMVDEGLANLDLSGRLCFPTGAYDDTPDDKFIEDIFKGVKKTQVLGNVNAPVVSDVINFTSNVYDLATGTAFNEYVATEKRVGGTFYVTGVDHFDAKYNDNDEKPQTDVTVTLSTKHIGKHEGNDKVAKFVLTKTSAEVKTDELVEKMVNALVKPFGVTATIKDGVVTVDGSTYWASEEPFMDAADPLCGPKSVILSVSRVKAISDIDGNELVYSDPENDLKVSTTEVSVNTMEVYPEGTDFANSVYGSSVSFINTNGAANLLADPDAKKRWGNAAREVMIDGAPMLALICEEEYDKTLMNVLQPGDCLLANDCTNDIDGDGEFEDERDGFLDNVYVQSEGTQYDENGNFMFHYITVSGAPLIWSSSNNEEVKYLIRIDAALNQEIGDMKPQYLEGYTYKNAKPAGLGMMAKAEWQDFILSALTDYKGLRVALLNKAEIDYRYVVDSFESFPVPELKKVLSYLCKEKQSAFCIANFPSVQTFVKCPYTSFTDAKGLFNVEYVVKGLNKKKPAAVKFSIPADMDGASFMAFYTPLKFSDGYVDSIIPSAGLVSNLFMQKYMSRQPYYIVAGPNYAVMNASGLVGPDYKYSMDELQIIEPFGVNCMVYRPNFGTFINANQTAKQIPLSALSKVNVRELVIFLQDEIEKLLQSYQWEFNNATTRQAILDKANSICELIKANGGIQAYVNIMDESNNTPEIIDNEMAVLSTHIEPGMGCGKMVHELTLYRTGQMASSIAD